MIEKYAANFINFMFRNYIYIEINVRNLDNPRSAVVRRISKDQLVVDNYVRGKIAHFIQTDDEGFALQLAAEWIETGYNPEGTKEMDDPTRTGVCEVCHDKNLLKADELIVENQRLTQELEEERRWIPFELIEPNTGDRVEFKDTLGEVYKGYYNGGFLSTHGERPLQITGVISWRPLPQLPKDEEK